MRFAKPGKRHILFVKQAIGGPCSRPTAPFAWVCCHRDGKPPGRPASPRAWSVRDLQIGRPRSSAPPTPRSPTPFRPREHLRAQRRLRKGKIEMREIKEGNKHLRRWERGVIAKRTQPWPELVETAAGQWNPRRIPSRLLRSTPKCVTAPKLARRANVPSHTKDTKVREEGVEPTHLAVLDPKSSASANSATLASLLPNRPPGQPQGSPKPGSGVSH
jgi:hypothetical protein